MFAILDGTNHWEPIQVLKGEENLKAWQNQILARAAHMKCDQCLKRHVKCPEHDATDELEEWRQEREYLMELMVPSLIADNAVRDKLEAAGWDILNGKDPYSFWQLVPNTIGLGRESCETYTMITHIFDLKLWEGETLSHFNDKVFNIANKANELGISIDKRLFTVAAMNAIRCRSPIDYQIVKKSFDKGFLSLEGLNRMVIEVAAAKCSDVKDLIMDEESPDYVLVGVPSDIDWKAITNNYDDYHVMYCSRCNRSHHPLNQEMSIFCC